MLSFIFINSITNFFNLVSKSVFFTRLVTLYFSNFGIKICFLTKSVTSGNFLSILSILSSKSDPSFSYLVLETKFVVSILSTCVTNLLYSVFLITSFLTTLLNLARSTGTVFNLPASIFTYFSL